VTQEPKQEDQRKEETMTKKSFFDSLSWQQDQGQGQKQPVKSFADQESESCLLSGSEDEDDFATLTSELSVFVFDENKSTFDCST
jgi:hypothetical protein